MTCRRCTRSAALALIAAGAVLLVCGLRERSVARAEEPAGLAAAAAIEEAVAAAIARAEKSVVSIARVADKRQAVDERQPDLFPRDRLLGQGPGEPGFVPTGFATGVVVGKGLIVTNHHALVLDEPSRFYITMPSRKVYAARVKGANAYSDLAVLEAVEPYAAEDFVPVTFGDGSALRKGQFVVALGNPYAIARDGQASASLGIVSNLQRKAAPQTGDAGLERPTLQHFGSLIQTDAKLNLGTSGGALINLKGEMVGLTTALAAVAGYEQAAGYAIPVDEAFEETLEKLKKGEERTHGLLGVQISSDDSLLIRGARIDFAFEAGPASRAGIRPNDVIVAVDDRPIRDRDDLMLNIGRLPAGRRTRVKFERQGRVYDRQVTLAKAPERGLSIVTAPRPAWRGLTVDYVTAMPEFPNRQLTFDNLQGPCVYVRDVAEGSPAHEAGLRRGMLVGQVGETRVETPDEFRDAVAGKEGDVELRLIPTMRSGETRITVPAEIAPAR